MKILASFIKINTIDELLDNFFYQSLFSLATLKPEIHFYFIVNSSVDLKDHNHPINIEVLVTKMFLGMKLFKKLNTSTFLSRKIKSLQPDIFFSEDMLSYENINCRKFFRADYAEVMNNKKLKKTDRTNYIIAANEWVKNKWISENPLNEISILEIGEGVQAAEPLSFEEKIIIKKKYTEEKDFFVVHDVSSDNNFITVLKAYSLFKKWQQSSMLLLLLIDTKNKNAFENILSNYKFRADVTLVDKYMDDAIKITQTAYASLFIQDLYRITTHMLLALRAGSPIILPKSDYFSSFFKESGFYVVPNEIDISKAMILIYKDENYRNALAEKGYSEVKINTWPEVANNLWQVISNLS